MTDAFRKFKTAFPEDACLEKLMRLRYGGTTIACPACSRRAPFEPVAWMRAYSCRTCGLSVYPCVGTPFEKTRPPLTDWFFAIHLMAGRREEASAKELERELRCPRPTAVRMLEELRKLAEQSNGRGPLAGWLDEIEAFVGPAFEVANAGRRELEARPRPVTQSRLLNSTPDVRLRPESAGSGSAPEPKTKVKASPRGAARAAAPEPAAVPRSGAPPAAAAIAVEPLHESITVLFREHRKQAVAGSLVALGLLGALIAFVWSIDFVRLDDRAPDLIAAPETPAEMLAVMDEDLDAAKEAVEFVNKNASSITLLPAEGSQPQPQAPQPQQQPTPQRPAQIVVTGGGDPNQILTFGPIKIRRHLVELIVRAGQVVGADPRLLMAVADKESAFRTEVKAQTSSATGLFQFIESTWLGVMHQFGAKHGYAKEAAAIQRADRRHVVADPAERERILELRREPYLSALLAAEMLKRDTLRIESRIGRHLTGGEVYLVHFLGPDGAELFIEKLAGSPELAAADLLPKPAAANRPIFFGRADDGKEKRLTVAEVHKAFEQMIKTRLDRYRDVRPGAHSPAPSTKPPTR